MSHLKQTRVVINSTLVIFFLITLTPGLQGMIEFIARSLTFSETSFEMLNIEVDGRRVGSARGGGSKLLEHVCLREIQ